MGRGEQSLGELVSTIYFWSTLLNFTKMFTLHTLVDLLKEFKMFNYMNLTFWHFILLFRM